MGWFRKTEEQQLLKAIDQVGFRVTAVGEGEDEPGFAYSTGFAETLGQPEVIVFGLPDQGMGTMIGALFDQCRAGLRLADGLEIAGLLGGHSCVLRAVKPDNIAAKYFQLAMWYHERQFGTAMTAAFQIVWPGSQSGLFPWDPDCSEAVRLLQPALYDTGTTP
jgi:hypothetical protein